MKKLIMIVLSGLLMLACGKQGSVSNKETGGTAPAEKTYKIGITQIVTHPSLDLAKEGFKKALEEAGLKTEFDEKNAEGSMANANLIATNFKSDKKDLVFGIATPSAQALANNISDIPVIFSAVTDPESAKILNQNVTGTSDRVDNIGEQLDLLLKLNPNAKKIGVLYNTSEQNSLVQVKDIEKIAKVHARYDCIFFDVVLYYSLDNPDYTFGSLSHDTNDCAGPYLRRDDVHLDVCFSQSKP